MKKFLILLLGISTVLFISQPAKAAVLPWQAVTDETHGLGAGFGDEANKFVTSTTTFGNYLYVATYNDNKGTEIWRTNNGTTWSQANTDGFGKPPMVSFSLLKPFGDYLYAIYCSPTLTSAYRTLDGTNWSLAKANIGSSDGVTINTVVTIATYGNGLYVGGVNTDGEAIVMGTTNSGAWHQINVDNFGNVSNGIVQSMASYNGKLYAGVFNNSQGTEVMAYANGAWGAAPDNIKGFNGTNHNISIGSLNEFNGQLYATTVNNDNGAEVWRSPGDGTWTKVANAGFNQGNVITDTYESIVFNGYLYVGANGARIFRTSNGTTWEQVNWTGFGNTINDLVSFGILGDYVYAGAGNLNVGPNTVRIYRYGTPPAPAPEILPETGADL